MAGTWGHTGAWHVLRHTAPWVPKRPGWTAGATDTLPGPQMPGPQIPGPQMPGPQMPGPHGAHTSASPCVESHPHGHLSLGGAPGHVGWGEVATPAAVLAWGPDPDPGTPHPPRVWGLGWVFVAAYETYWLEGHAAFQPVFHDGGSSSALPQAGGSSSGSQPTKSAKGAEAPRTALVWTAEPAQLLLVSL